MTPPAKEYMGAFLDGYEFLLLAFEGRFSDEGLDDGPNDGPDDLDAFLDDYHRILELHRKHLEEGAEAPEVEPLEEFPSSLLPESRN